MQQEPAALKQFNDSRDAWRILKLESHPIANLEGSLTHSAFIILSCLESPAFGQIE